MEPDSHAGAKDLFKLILHSPALLVSVLVGLALIIYFLVKYGPSSQQNASTTSGTTTASTGTPVPQFTGSYWNENGPRLSANVTPPPATTAVSTPPVSTAPTAGSPVPGGAIDLATIRSKGSIPTVASYDAKNTGVPIRSAAGSGNDQIGSIGFGTQIQITGPAVQGTSNFTPGQTDTGNGTDLWYPVTSNGKTGYVSAFDVTNSYQQ